jgi:putative ABC transport system permease protein
MSLIQFFTEGFLLAFGALWSNKVRTFLTMLGVATGIFAITSILTMTYSMQYSVSANLSALGNTVMFVHNWPWKDNSSDWFKYFNRPKVSYKDYEALKKNLKNIEAISFSTTANNMTVKAEGRSTSGVSAYGVTEEYGMIGDWNFEEGRYISEWEFESGAPVCIIGQNIAKAIFEGTSPVGKFVYLGGRKLKVIGLRAKAGSGSFGPSIDDQLFVPYKYAARKFDLNRRSIDKVITIKATNYDMVGYVESEVTGIIRASRGLKPTVEDNFSINKQEMIMKQIDTIFGYLEKSGIVIAGFSLLIGVFSIGNIMYISVKERTNEIGVQKALGSTQPFILYQFLIESVLVCIFGGMLGMLCLYGAVAAAQYAIQKMEISMQIIVSQGSVQAAIFLSLGIGLLAGIIPAFLAARVDPVIAIRSK